MEQPAVSTDTLVEVARSLAEQEGLDATLQRIVDLAVRTVPGAEHAGVSLVRSRRVVETPAATGDVVVRVDQVQYETGQGPCLDAIWEQEVVELQDLSATDRWPEFAHRATELGVRSMVSFRLFVERDTSGALNFYSSNAQAFGQEAVRVGHVFAAHAGLAYDHEKQVSGLRRAVESRTLIGQAQGILMAQHRVTADQAFGLLRVASQRRNVKLRDVAQEVVDTGTVSGAP
ncbi:MAG: GAF and ANTAR domain-containing protein [Actinomycetota bacterium]|nr:GAF and ANTAR domain-containing protein [Actinomycetota bacterium]